MKDECKHEDVIDDPCNVGVLCKDCYRGFTYEEYSDIKVKDKDGYGKAQDES